MDKLVSVLKSMENKLHEFDWEIPNSCPLSIPQTIQGNFERNLYLKDNFSLILKNDAKLEHHYWLIQDWGGIRSLKRNEKNDKRLRKFKKQLEKRELTRDTFEVISSFSKVASFWNPEKFVIYDSRVIYALNWLIFKYSDDKKLFPQPSGRSALLAKYDMQTIFRLSKHEGSYIPYKTAYFDYCNLIISLSRKIYPNSKPYRLEMLLFLIAPKYIVNDIEKSVSLAIDVSASSYQG